MSIEQTKFPQSVEASYKEQAFEFSNTLSKEQTEQLKNLFAQAFNTWSASKA